MKRDQFKYNIFKNTPKKTIKRKIFNQLVNILMGFLKLVIKYQRDYETIGLRNNVI